MPHWLLISIALALGLAGIMLATPLGNGTVKPSVPNYSPDALNALIAVMHESDVDTGSKSIVLKGVVSASEEWTQLLEQFRKSVPETVTLSIDVFVIDGAFHLDVLCPRVFATLADQSVSFQQSGTEFRSSSDAVLDRIVEFAGDCRQSTIVLTGHSDASGDENYNRSLSEARAQVVANYLQARGVAAERLVVEGAGSDFPIADNATPQGREKNRRIEFALQ